MKEVYQIVERSTNKVKKSGNYWKILNICVEKGTNLYYTRLKHCKTK
jgi:hypothetical protein